MHQEPRLAPKLFQGQLLSHRPGLKPNMGAQILITTILVFLPVIVV